VPIKQKGAMIYHKINDVFVKMPAALRMPLNASLCDGRGPRAGHRRFTWNVKPAIHFRSDKADKGGTGYEACREIAIKHSAALLP
jgi:hypothetical protein